MDQLIIIFIFTKHSTTKSTVYGKGSGSKLRRWAASKTERRRDRENHTYAHHLYFTFLSYFPRDELNSLLPKLNKKAVTLWSNVYVAWGNVVWQSHLQIAFFLSLFVVNYMRFHFYFISFFTLRSRKNCLFLVSIRIAYGIWYDRQLELDGLSYQSICLKNNYVC